MTIYQRIKELANEKGISIRELENELHFSNGTLNKWKDQANSEKLKNVADHFNVSVDFLLGKNDDDQSKLVGGLFRKVSAEYDLDDKEKKELQEDFSDYLAVRAKRLKERRKNRDK